MFPFRNILLPTDFSANAHAALKYAAAFARHSGGRVVLFSVQDAKSGLRSPGEDWLSDPVLSGVDAVIAEALRSLERSMARNPRELIVETILEGYRHEHRILSGELADDTDADMFGELLAKAQQDGKLAAHVDVRHLSHLAGMHVSEGVRHWAAGTYGDRSFAEVVSRDIAALIAGYNRLPS